MPPEDPSELIHFIVTRYHQAHHNQLLYLTALSQNIDRVHADRPDVPLGLGDLLQGLIRKLEGYMKMDEHILFPAILRGNRERPRVRHDTSIWFQPLRSDKTADDEHGDSGDKKTTREGHAR